LLKEGLSSNFELLNCYAIFIGIHEAEVQRNTCTSLKAKNCGKMVSRFKREGPCAALDAFHKVACFTWQRPLLHRVCL